MRLERGSGIGERYTLVGRLGSGGMADVWLADDAVLKRRVALKFLHERFAQDPQFVERFRIEAQSAAGLQHPNLVGVYDRGEFEGRQFIAMEYVEGASLKDLIVRGLSVGEALEIVRQVLDGVGFAHERGIIHRDLKPQNVLVDGQGRARVTDFGIARAGASEITQTGSVLGTAQYLSPEQAQGLDVTAASDLYSVGVMLYEALTGRVPFEAETPVAVALKQISEQPSPPSQLNPEVSPALDAVVLRALAKDPANRFGSAGEFSRALDAAEADPDHGALGATAAYAAIAAAPDGIADADAAPPPPVDDDHGWMTRRRAIALAAIALVAAGVVVWALTRPSTVKVPALIERSLPDARAELEGKGFAVGVSPIESCDPRDTVIEQAPPAGTEADEGSKVTLTVSLGQRVRVPQLAGVRLDQARSRLDKANLLVKTQDRASRNVKPGNVISSTPAGGAEVECESTITLLVSKGPNLVSLPSVLGRQQEEAQSTLERLGFIVNVDTRDADEPEGTVIAQDPGPGSRLLRGDNVTIVVSTGAGAVIVPDVVGQSEDAARSLLLSRGLSIDVIDQDTEERSEDGRVLQQAPAAGSRVRGGDSVTIAVGKFTEPTTSTTSPSTTTSSTTTSSTTGQVP